MNIDRIAREMVDVEPSIDLEARIRRRLSDAPSHRTAAWWTWRIAAPLVAVAATIALVIIAQGPASRSLPAEAAPAGAIAAAGLPAEAAPAGAIAKAGPRVIKTSQPRKSPTSQFSSEEIAWMERRIPALDQLNALQMDHLRVDSIQPEPLAITPLTITPVTAEGGGIERRNDR